jgi:hypothetical protein
MRGVEPGEHLGQRPGDQAGHAEHAGRAGRAGETPQRAFADLDDRHPGG